MGLEKESYHLHFHKGDLGFSLIELMVVVAIIAILVAVTVPAYNTYTLHTKNEMVKHNFDVAVRFVEAACQESASCIENDLIESLGRKSRTNPCGQGKPFVSANATRGQIEIDVQPHYVFITGYDCSTPPNTFSTSVFVE